MCNPIRHRRPGAPACLGYIASLLLEKPRPKLVVAQGQNICLARNCILTARKKQNSKTMKVGLPVSGLDLHSQHSFLTSRKNVSFLSAPIEISRQTGGVEGRH